MFSNWFKKKEPKEPPILKPEMLEPVEAPISTADAKRIFKEWMVRIGHFADNDRINGIDTLSLSMHADYMTDQIKEHGELLREEASVAKADTADEVKELKESIRELKGLLAKCKDPAERAEIEAEIAESQHDIIQSQNDWSLRAKALADFKADKREFLVDYINRQVHGPQWREKL